MQLTFSQIVFIVQNCYELLCCSSENPNPDFRGREGCYFKKKEKSVYRPFSLLFLVFHLNYKLAQRPALVERQDRIICSINKERYNPEAMLYFYFLTLCHLRGS